MNHSFLKKLLWLGLLLSLAGGGALLASRSTAAQKDPLAYNRLRADQRRLFESWATAQDKANGTAVAAADRYAGLAVPTRTAFEAITHALSRSTLTSPSGKSMGRAIDLVGSLEGIAGEVDGAGGDKQFRLYVKLAPGAVGKLGAVKEFTRGKDNTIFHHGYPVNFRQRGKPPTLQFSVTQEGDRADIDVDYRSSHVPAALVNGHLSAGNSDVRAGNNYFTHAFRWQGLINWWSNVLEQLAEGIEKELARATGSKDRKRDDHLPAEGHPDAPEAGTVAATADAFLKAWLLDRDLTAARSFMTRKLVVCADVDGDSNLERVRENRIEALFLETLKEANKALGKPRSIEAAIAEIEPWQTRLKLIDHPARGAYALASLDGPEFNKFVCSDDSLVSYSSSPIKKAAFTLPADADHGASYLISFRLKLEGDQGGGLILLWVKEDGAWKIGSFDVVNI